MATILKGARASGKGEMPWFATPPERQIRHHVKYVFSVATGKPVLNTIPNKDE